MDFKVKGDSFIYVKLQGCNSQVSRDTCVLIEGRVFIWGDLESCCTGQRTKAPQAAQVWFISAEGASFRKLLVDLRSTNKKKSLKLTACTWEWAGPQKEMKLPAIDFQGRAVSFREGTGCMYLEILI